MNGDPMNDAAMSERPMSEASLSEGLRVRVRKQLFRARRPGFLLDVDLVALPGFTVLFGPSGAGKSTLLDCVAGLLTPDEGEITIAGVPLFHSRTRTDVPTERRRAGYVVQDLALFPHLTAEQNVAYGLDAMGDGLPRAERRQRVAAMLASFGIAELARQRPEEISGGQRQRVALARALVTEPRVLLLDEPLSGLDDATKGKIVADLRAWNERRSIPVLYVTHDRDEVAAIGGRLLPLQDGRLLPAN
ncbi:MAG: ATP-binding cassette domain-containing protein [Acidobacteriota bacterium]|nr:ATP-binding cassette domain-containing protein [Acidobacteriota bacterium]